MAYFYFDFNDEKKQCQKSLVRSLIAQLSIQNERHSEALHTLYCRSRGGRYQPSYDGLIGTLESMLQSHRPAPQKRHRSWMLQMNVLIEKNSQISP
jgi:hypothetical protein